MQQRPPLQTRVDVLPHPAGGGRGYEQPMRALVLKIQEMGETHNPLLVNLRQQYMYPSLVTEHRW